MAAPDDIDAPSRYLIGIDLGTTNSALAYVDTDEKIWTVRDLPIPQLTAPGTVEARATLPSFHYEPAASEFAPQALRLPWDTQSPSYVVGAFARDHGAAMPGRLVVSAKSWLSHSGVDRTAGLLPWHGAADVARLSPVEVSARYLAHLRGIWDAAFALHPMASQDIVLAVPASFDEVARELTIAAARMAGLSRVVLVEEPQAAFYAWINAQGDQWDRRVRPGQKILVCDIGGGTSDFTLIRVRPAAGGRVLFHRVAVGEHLILGGDNLDLAIAQHVEEKLGPKLEPRQWGALVRASRVAKETLLGHAPPDRFVVNVAAGGARLVGGATLVDLARDEIAALLLDGFLPRVSLAAKPAARRSGFQEFGLPYARDAAITRYLAAFLTAHRHAGDEAIGESGASDQERHAAQPDHDPARPDLVLFNGGLFESPVLRQRLLDVLASWFSDGQWKPEVLENQRLDLAVARGAAYYGAVRRGRGVRISGGLAHSYYVGVEASDAQVLVSTDAPSPRAVCLLPAGVEEGQTVDLPGRAFDLLIRQPVEFPLYVSSVRTVDRPGALVSIDPEQMSALPPIRTVLQSGRKSAAESVRVRLGARLTEIGTLDIWCAEVRGERSWRLQFDIRSATRADIARHEGQAETQGVLDEAVLAACRGRIGVTFGPGSATSHNRPESLMKSLEELTGLARSEWPATLLRGMWETMMQVEAGRRKSDAHEARWLNLTGFCMRPGYGLAADDWRVAQTWKLMPAGVGSPRNELVRAEWWILWRRLAGGMTPGQQRTLAEPLIADWRLWLRKGGANVRGRSPAFQFGPHESAEVWRLLGSLEHLTAAAKQEIGQLALDRLPREPTPSGRDAIHFALGRLGSRVPMYGPLNALVDPQVAQAWLSRLMSGNNAGDKVAFALVQLARKTGDRYRDISDAARETARNWLAAHQAPEHYQHLVLAGGELAAEEQKTVFGESLPRGLKLA